MLYLNFKIHTDDLKSYDAIIIGSGPNGLAAAITLQRQGLSTLLVEGADTVGGGMRTKELTLPGFKHDVCSAIHPMALGSPFMRSLPLEDFGLAFKIADFQVSQPLDSGRAVVLHQDMKLMQQELGQDYNAYQALLSPFVKKWDSLSKDLLGPLRFPNNPLLMAKFGLSGLRSAHAIADRFQTVEAKALWSGLVAHGILPFNKLSTAAIGMVLGTLGHQVGWPIPVGGSQAIADSMLAYYESLGGELQLNFWLEDVRDLPKHKVLILDLTPLQILKIKGLDLLEGYSKQLEAYRYGMGVFKMDWALSDPTPFSDGRSQFAATVHIGNTFAEIAKNELDTYNGKLVDRPFVLFAQPSKFDPTRSQEGKHTAWAYCHVPNGSFADRSEAIENQIERFAPGFRDTVLARSSMNTGQLEQYNPNYIGGDINAGQMDIMQLFTRPTKSLTPYRTSNPNVYIGSSSTPPAGGVHGMCGYHAARIALKDHYHIKIKI